MRCCRRDWPGLFVEVGCGAAEATGPGFVCFVVINPCVLSANRVVFGLFLFQYPPPTFRPRNVTLPYIFLDYDIPFKQYFQ